MLQVTETGCKQHHPEIFSCPFITIKVRGRNKIRLWAVLRIQRAFKAMVAETKTSKSDTNITEMKDDSEAARVEGEQEVEVEAAIGDDATVYAGNGDEDESKEDVEEVIPIYSNLGNNSEAESDNKLEDSVLQSEEDVGSTDNKLEEDDGSTVVADATQSDESEKKAEAEQRPFIHKYYACDSCNMKPIVGTRYRAINKENLDVCEACVGKLEEQGIEFESAQDRKLRPFEVDGKTPHVWSSMNWIIHF